MLLICYSHFHYWESLLKVFFSKNSQETQAKKGLWTHFFVKLIEVSFYQFLSFYHYTKNLCLKCFWAKPWSFTDYFGFAYQFLFFRTGKCLQARFPKITQAKNIFFKVSCLFFSPRFQWDQLKIILHKISL